MEDEFNSQEREAIRKCLVQKLNEANLAIAHNEAAPVELDQSRVGRLARLDSIQHQQIAKVQVARMRALIPIYQQRLRFLREHPEDFGDCILCGEKIPLKRLMIRPEVQTCVPCLESSGG